MPLGHQQTEVTAAVYVNSLIRQPYSTWIYIYVYFFL